MIENHKTESTIYSHRVTHKDCMNHCLDTKERGVLYGIEDGCGVCPVQTNGRKCGKQLN